MALDALALQSSFEAVNSQLQDCGMLNVRDICSLTEFQRNTKEHLARLRETGRPSVLTINGRAEAVILSAEAFQRMADRLERLEVLDGIRRGREDVARGDTLPLDEAFDEIREAAARRRRR